MRLLLLCGKKGTNRNDRKGLFLPLLYLFVEFNLLYSMFITVKVNYQIKLASRYVVLTVVYKSYFIRIHFCILRRQDATDAFESRVYLSHFTS